jgi:DNA-directed RNA polymerase specialized sigma24 family protein
MSTLEIKSGIHRLVDETNSEYLLEAVYQLLKSKRLDSVSRTWDSLTEEQRQEILLAYEESENENNLISREEVFRVDK